MSEIILPTAVLGEAGEDHALRLLRTRGYASAQKLKVNTPVVDLEVGGSRPFRVSVKAARDRQHVRLGSYRSSSASDLTTSYSPSFPPENKPFPSSREAINF